VRLKPKPKRFCAKPKRNGFTLLVIEGDNEKDDGPRRVAAGYCDFFEVR
jgi:hypothetical protein